MRALQSFICTVCILYSSTFALVHASFPSLLDADISAIQSLLDAGQTTSVELVYAYNARISEVNDRLHAVGELNPHALLEAQALDHERKVRGSRGRLHGIPVLVKDNIAALGMNNTGGSVCLLGATFQHEATVVSNLRRAGAIVLGKATLSEWAMFRSSSKNDIVGWSGYGGMTTGAFYDRQWASGSSTGSAVAMSIGLAAATIGTETSGSIISPSDHHALVGLKPTLGLTSRYMVIPNSLRQDVIGPLVRTVTDAAIMLSALAGTDRRDNYTNAQPWRSPPDYLAALNASRLQGARLGVPWEATHVVESDDNSLVNGAQIMKAFNHTLDILRDAGATIIDVSMPLFEDPDTVRQIRGNVSIYTFADYPPDLATYLSQLDHTSIRSLEDVVNCTKKDVREMYPQRDIISWESCLNASLSPDSPEVYQAHQFVRRRSGPDGLFAAIDDYKLDALILPTRSSSSLPAVAGSPLITVPMGQLDRHAETIVYHADEPEFSNIVGPGMPFGLSFLGKEWSEETLLALAYSYEQKTMVRERVRPRIVPRTELSGYRGEAGNDDGGIVEYEEL